MPGFTDEEVQSVIDKLVLVSIRRDKDVLGSRRTDVTFSDIQQAAAGVFLLSPATPLYFVGLASSRLSEAIEAAEATCTDLASALGVLRRRVVPVRDVSALSNARAALLELEGAVARGGPPKDVTRVPAYARFNANVDRFLGAVGTNIKVGTSLVPTPDEARSKIPALVTRLRAQVTAIVTAATQISLALEDYSAVNLPKLVSGGIIGRARALLSTRTAALEAMNDAQRLAVLRDTVLEVLGARAVVRRFGSFSPPVSLSDIQGLGRGYADDGRPAFEARLEAEEAGPYALVPGLTPVTSSNVLNLYLDTAAPPPAVASTQFFLPSSIVAKVEGVMAGPFDIQVGVNDSLLVVVDGVPTTVPLTAGSRTAQQVAANITSALTPKNFQGEAYFFPLMFDGEVTATNNFGAMTSEYTLAFGYFPPGSVTVGSEVDIYYGAGAGTVGLVVTDVTTVSGNITKVSVAGPQPEGPARIRYGASARRVRITPIDKTLSVLTRQELQLKMPTTLERTTGTTLGFYGELLGRSVPTDAEVIADYVTQNSQTFRAETRFVLPLENVTVRTNPADPTRATAFYVRGQATWDAGTMDVPFVLAEDPDRDLVGDVLCVRAAAGSPVAGLVTAQTGPNLSVSFLGPLGAGQGLVEVGPGAAISPGMVLVVDRGPNAGSYHVDAVDGTAIDFKLRELFPVYRNGLDVPVMLDARLGKNAVTFLSRTKDLSSAVGIDDPLGTFMLNTGYTKRTGTTPYFLLPARPKNLELGDYLEFFTTTIETPDVTATITELSTDAVVKLDVPVSSVGTWTFGENTLPAAHLRTAKLSLYEGYARALKTWLGGTNAPQYFTRLNGLIQPLLANQNPTDSDVGTAEQNLEVLRTMLGDLTEIVGGYDAPYVSDADALMRAYQEKGADRAADFLVSCQFQTFFGLSQDEVSYSGNMMATARAVAQNDLPVSRYNRPDQTRGQLVASVDSPDYETDFPDLDPTPNIDPPVQAD